MFFLINFSELSVAYLTREEQQQMLKDLFIMKVLPWFVVEQLVEHTAFSM